MNLWTFVGCLEFTPVTGVIYNGGIEHSNNSFSLKHVSMTWWSELNGPSLKALYTALVTNVFKDLLQKRNQCI